MKTFPILVLLILAVPAFAGCAPHHLTFHDRTGTAVWSGEAPRQWGDTGEVTARIDGETYRGHWQVLQSLSVGLSQTFGAAPTQSIVFGAGSLMPGKMFLTAPSGRRVTCEFQYSEASMAGFGACRRTDGREYDLTIETP